MSFPDLEDVVVSPVTISAASAAAAAAVVSQEEGDDDLAPADDTPIYEDSYYDVVLIGAGVVGCALSRELSRYSGLRVLVVEAGKDVGSGATKGNSGIAHGGYDAHHGTLKSKLCYTGTQMFAQLNKELSFGYRRIGSLVLAFSKEGIPGLRALYQNGVKNGVTGLEVILDRDRIYAMEPNVSRGVVAALYCPHTGVVSPYEYCIALMESALINAGAGQGMELWLEHTVCDVHVFKEPEEQKEGYKFQLFFDEHETKRVNARYVVNCCGVRADMVAAFAGASRGLNIVPRKGEYVILQREEGKKINHVLFQVPTKHGKGILVTPTARGNLMLGPTSVYSDSVNTGTTRRHLSLVLKKARKTFPGLDVTKVLTSFAGIRPNSDRAHRDFVIEECKRVSRWVNVAGIGSPGLTCSYPIALMVMGILSKAGLSTMHTRPHWQAHRRGIIAENWMLDTPAAKKAVEHQRFGHPNPSLNIVCRCEHVTEQTIIDACYRRIPVTTLQAVKLRTRAGMGRCQGRRCGKLVAELVSVASGIPAAEVLKGDEDRVGRRVPNFEVSKL